MNKKKIVMIILLIIFAVGIGIAVVKMGDKSVRANEELNGQKNATAQKTDIEITDNFFIEQTNDIYLNLKDYIGKTIKMEGLIYTYLNEDGNTGYAVVRNSPGCCGNDGLAGLDIKYNGEYPEEDTWVTIEGKIEKQEIHGESIPIINLTSMKETEVGKTFVTN